MAAGRNQVDYTGIRADQITAKIDGVTLTYDATKTNGIGKAAGTGDAVTLSANDTVALTDDGNYVYGKVLKIERDLFATIQKWGMADLPAGAGAAITRGRKIVGDLGAGGARGFIREADPAVDAEIAVARGEIINNAVSTNTIVDLG
jgi:hypothetical protein